MRCEPRALSDLFFGELPVDAAARIQRHAAACVDCTRTLDGLRSDRARFRSRRAAPPSLDRMFAEVERRLDKPRQRLRWRPQAFARGLVPLGGALLALLLALLSPAIAVSGASDGRGATGDLEDALSMCIASPQSMTPDDLRISVAPPPAPSALACF